MKLLRRRSYRFSKNIRSYKLITQWYPILSFNEVWLSRIHKRTRMQITFPALHAIRLLSHLTTSRIEQLNPLPRKSIITFSPWRFSHLFCPGHILGCEIYPVVNAILARPAQRAEPSRRVHCIRCKFRSTSNTNSGKGRTPIPVISEHPFQS